MPQSTAISPAASHPHSVLWGYLFAIACAELLTNAVEAQLGLILHSLILITVLVHRGLRSDEHAGELALGLALAPLIRILSLSLPLSQFSRPAWYPFVGVPVLAATFIIGRQLRVSRQDLGLHVGSLPLQLMVAGIGFATGAVEYAILDPEPLLVDFTWPSFWLQSLNLLVFTGLVEELIFRGLLQSLALRVMGRSALVFVSLLFATLHIGYHSVADFLFVFAVGMVFAYLVLWSRSLVGVILAHGTTNVTLFLIMPYLAQTDDPGARILAALTLGSGSALALIATTVFFLGATRRANGLPKTGTG